jgi:hypothetical protein
VWRCAVADSDTNSNSNADSHADAYTNPDAYASAGR